MQNSIVHDFRIHMAQIVSEDVHCDFGTFKKKTQRCKNEEECKHLLTNLMTMTRPKKDKENFSLMSLKF